MGCDYYIIKLLKITFNDDEYYYEKPFDFSTIELDRNRCYFPEIYDEVDSDDSYYDEKIQKIQNKYNDYLIVTYEPRILYENSQWKNEKICEKYKQILKENNYDLYKIKSIIKEEVRYLS